MVTSSPFGGVTELQTWVASGGVGRARLPVNSADELLRNLTTFASAAGVLSDLLKDIRSAWDNVGGDNTLKASVGLLLNLMGEAVVKSKTGTQRAMDVKISANKLYGILDRHITSTNEKIELKNAAITKSKTKIKVAKRKVQEARSKLNAGDIILNALEAIVTFGTKDRNRENLNKLEISLTTIKAELFSLKVNRDLLISFKNEMNALRNGITRILNVDQAMTSFQNDLLAAAPMISGAYQNIEKSETTTNIKVANIRLQKARPLMDNLLAWIDAFKFKN